MKTEVEDKLQRTVSEGTVGRIMKRLGLTSIIRRRNKFKYAQQKIREGLPCNLLERDFEATEPGFKFVTDVTYIPYVSEGHFRWAYLSIVLDLYDRNVVSWVLSKKQDQRLANATLSILSGKYHQKDAILHSDQGSIYTSNEFQALVELSGFRQSLSRRGNCWDNAAMESFNASLKTEWLYNPHCFEAAPSFEQIQRSIAQYMKFYNETRIHSSIGNVSPKAKREQFFIKNETPNFEFAMLI